MALSELTASAAPGAAARAIVRDRFRRDALMMDAYLKAYRLTPHSAAAA